VSPFWTELGGSALVGADELGMLNIFSAGAWWRRDMRVVSVLINRPFDTPPESPPDQPELFDLDRMPQF